MLTKEILIGAMGVEDKPESELKEGALRCVKRLRTPGQSEERYLSYLGGRFLLGELLNRKGITGWVEPNREFGYLTLTDGSGNALPHPFVNISHTSGKVFAAVGSRTVGVDVESVTRDASRVAERVSDEDEWKSTPPSVSVSGGVVPGALALWCAKEAVSKAIGLGVVFGMKAFRIDLTAGNPFPVKLFATGPLTMEDPAVWLQVRDGFLFAVCSEKAVLGTAGAERIRWLDELEVR